MEGKSPKRPKSFKSASAPSVDALAIEYFLHISFSQRPPWPLFLFHSMKNNEQAQTPRLLDVNAAGRYLGISAWTVRELCWAGQLQFCRVGRLIRLDVRDLDQFIDANKHQTGVR
jgi:excisionase family DNA binding protein